MSPNQQLIILMLLAFNLAGLGMVLVYLGAKRGRGRRSRRLNTNSTSSAAWRDVAPVFDDAWPEICFDMDVGTTCLAGMALLFFAFFMGLLASISISTTRNAVVNIVFFVFPIIVLILGCVTLLSCLPQWRSRIALEAERLIVYPTFRRSPRVVNYDQIWDVGAGEERFVASTGAIIYHYPLDYGGQVDVTRMCKMGLPSTSQNEGLHLVLQARIAGPPPDPELQSAFFAKQFFRPLTPFVILLGILLLAEALQPENRGRPEFMYLGLFEIFLALIMIVIGWPRRRE
jgi:hypothetical protein